MSSDLKAMESGRISEIQKREKRIEELSLGLASRDSELIALKREMAALE